MLLIVDQYSGLARGYFIKDAQTGTLKPLLQRILGEIERQDNSYPEVLECDNEIMKHTSIMNMLIAPPYSLRIKPSAPDTQAQNGGVERIVGVIKQKLVAMRASAKFPAYLIKYIYAAAIYLYKVRNFKQFVRIIKPNYNYLPEDNFNVNVNYRK